MAKRNYNYGKLENGNLIYAPNMLIVTITDNDGNEWQAQLFNAPAWRYAEQGWLPVVRTTQPSPEDGGWYSPTYSIQDGSIVQSWEYVEYNYSMEV